MYKYTLTLKQETPLIHFQGHQDGAFLRGSEVKPKFDKFLRKYADDEVGKFSIGNTDALNYKIRISGIEKVKEIDKKDMPFYFNDIGDNKDNGVKDNNVMLFSENNFQMEFVSRYKDLIDVIKEWIDKFLLSTNFGFRQGKGYGSFINPKSNLKEVDVIKDLNKDKLVYYIDFNVNGRPDRDYKRIMKEAEKIYRNIKSGFNRRRPDIFEYMKKKNIGDEKYFIKNKIIDNNKKDVSNCKYLKGLLGISEGEDYKINEEDTIRIVYEPKSEEVERFPSPISFKIFSGKLFIIVKQIPKDVYGSEFYFYQKDKTYKEKPTIKIPTEKEFSLKKFMDYCSRCKYNNKIKPLNGGDN